MNSIGIIIVSAAVFLALVLWLTSDARHIQRFTGVAFVVAIVGGLYIYGMIESAAYADTPIVAILRTMVRVGQMYGNAGAGSYDAFLDVVGKSTVASIFYWTVHFFAYFTVIGAVVQVVGKNLLRKLRTWLLRIHDVELVYGVDENTVKLGEAVTKDRRVSLVFVGNGKVSESVIQQMGALWYVDADAMGATSKFIKRLVVKKGRGRFRLSALSSDDEANFLYAIKMLKSLKEAGIEPSQTELVMFGRESMIGTKLQALNDVYGFGSVRVFDREELAARLLVRKHPLSETITFDDNARAVRDVEILLVGFGRIGQEILRKFVASGQFEGSNFRITVFDPDYDKRDGFFLLRYPALVSEYNIVFEPYDGRSKRLADFVKNNADRLTEIVVAVGDESDGREITYGILDLLVGTPAESIPVYQCYKDHIISKRVNEESKSVSVYDPEIINGDKLDELALQINHYYCGDSESAEEQWKSCDYFSRMSCRASADYLSDLLLRVGVKGPEDLTAERLENLGKTEHLRWCAFHYSMGYERMSDEEREERAAHYREDKKVRITKDTVNKRHACLIPWDDLDALSEYENSITGKNLDYKQMDRDNVVAMVKLLKTN